MRLSAFARGIEPSATLAAGAKAKELKAAGKVVHDFSLGEPDFNTPEHICAAARKAMAEGRTHYTPASGTPELKRAICHYHQTRHGLDYRPENVCVSNGCKHTIFTALAATLDPGDEVLIPAPYWVSYSEMVKMTGAKPIILPTTPAERFLIPARRLRDACGPKTRMIMLNSPSNPTGMTYSPDQLRDIADLVIEKDLICLSDEIYEQLRYGDTEFRAFASLGKEVFDRTLTVNGVSKTYAMTGWRIGWTAGPAAIIAGMSDIQSQQTSNPCSISQDAATAALLGDQACVGAMREEFAQRRDYVIGRLQKMPGLSLVPPTGAFYAFFDVSSYFGKSFGNRRVSDSASFCMALLEQAHVVLVQGSAFGAEGFVRMSFATSRAALEVGLDALASWLASARE